MSKLGEGLSRREFNTALVAGGLSLFFGGMASEKVYDNRIREEVKKRFPFDRKGLAVAQKAKQGSGSVETVAAAQERLRVFKAQKARQDKELERAALKLDGRELVEAAAIILGIGATLKGLDSIAVEPIEHAG